MRDINRIDEVIDLIIPDRIKELIEVYWELPPQSEEALSRICVLKEIIRDEWKVRPDLRFSQVLINLFLLPNYPGFWYYKEDEEILKYFEDKYSK